MRIIESVAEMQAQMEEARRHGENLGLVPTMGFFHEGHLSLMRRARAECSQVAVSLFVNTAQFAPGEDLASYPRDLERDCALAEGEGVDVMFAPKAGEVYGPDHAAFVTVERLSETLCGGSRPGHFRGVATVVAKLFNICKPHRAYFGLKDYQQIRVIEAMIRDLNFDLDLVRCPIVREADGLAMSSRNSYLSSEERRAATVLRRALVKGRELIDDGERDASAVVRSVRAKIETEPLALVDYVEVADADSLQPLGKIENRALLAVAARFGRARLIDNSMAEVTD